MKFTVYVLLSDKDGNLYTGYSDNLRNRMQEHHAGKVYSTRHRLPVHLIYYEVCGSEKDSRLRERYLKTGMGKRYIRNRLKHYFSQL